MLSQNFTIFVSNDGKTITFKECYERFSEPQQQCLDEKQLIDLDPPVLKLSFESKRTNDACIELTSHISKKPLRTFLQNMKKTTEDRDTILLGWRATTESIENVVSRRSLLPSNQSHQFFYSLVNFTLIL
jgi:hypothetical protein